MNDPDAAATHTARPSRAAAGEDPHALRNRLKDAATIQSAKQSDEREELQAVARDREPDVPVAKRRWRRAR